MSLSVKKLLSIGAAAVSAVMLSSCVYVDPGPPYSSSGAYRSAPVNTGYAHRPAAYGGRPIYRDPYYSHQPYDSHRGHSSQRHDNERIKLTAGQQRGKGTRPSGYHTRDWYEKKGYDLDNYKHKHEESGKTHSGSSYRSTSSSRSKSSSKSKSSSRPKSSSRSKSSSNSKSKRKR